MTINRVGALRAERDELVTFCRSLNSEEWETPSRCAGWTLKDVVSHMGAACHGTFTPWVIKLMRSKDLERSNDADVEDRRAWPADKVLGEYETWSRRFATVQSGLQHRPPAAVPLRLGDVGTYPAHLLASAIVFDTHLHLRHDMATAVGRNVPPTDNERIAVAVEWMMAGLVPMSAGALDWMDRPVEINLAGGGGGTWGVMPQGGGHPIVRPGPVPDPAARIGGSAQDFPVWGTGRQRWRSADVTVTGEEAFGIRFLDGVRIV